MTRLDLTNQPIDRCNIDPLADTMGIEFGIRELVLNNCGLEDDASIHMQIIELFLMLTSTSGSQNLDA